MELCVSCGESYESEKAACPFCGCPKDWRQIPEETFTGEEARRYSTIRIRKTAGPEVSYLIWDNAEQKKKLLILLPEGNDGYCHYVDLKTIVSSHQKKSEYLPEILRLSWNEAADCGYYICALTEGVTLREALEREKPLCPELAERLQGNRQRIVRQMAKLMHVPPEKCRVQEDSILFAEDGRVLITDYEFLYGDADGREDSEKTIAVAAGEGGAERRSEKVSLAEMLKRRIFRKQNKR